jgi:hypothetical protein
VTFDADHRWGLPAALLLCGVGCAESDASSTLELSPSVIVEDVASVNAPAPSASAPPAPVVEFESTDLPEADVDAKSLPEQRAAMLRRMIAMGVTDQAGSDALTTIMNESKMMGQGNPAVTEHPMTRSECIQRRKDAKIQDEKQPRCGAPFMAPIYNPETTQASEATLCIDRFEFPGLPCEYPLTYATTKQANKLCKAIGKRLCDAHEWEGACAGALLPAEEEYAFGRERSVMRNMHNNRRDIVWSYGRKKDHKKCATTGNKSKDCTSSSWKQCGSNTFPAGAFPQCKSPFGVYDLNGNAAEHMSLPMKKEQLGRDGGFGQAEMKGSWFVFSTIEAHEDDCRWRAPSWHDNEGTNHSNYHLGFRCCKDIK